MGRCRCISKPFKRYAFKLSKRIATEQVRKVYVKYTGKYKNKCVKNNIPSRGLHIFQMTLREKLANEQSVSHGKTREYWMLRGPRLFLIIFIGIVSNIICNLFIKDDPEILFSMSSGSIWLILSAYMLYQRLPDAISSSLMRVGHDHYIEWKKRELEMSTPV